MRLAPSYVQGFPLEANQRVNFYMTHYGHGPGEVVRGFALDGKMPCRTLDLSQVIEDQTGYFCGALGKKHRDEKPERTDEDRAREAAAKRRARLSRYILSAGGMSLYFCTFTFKDAVADQKEAAKAWYNFTRRWLVHYKKNLKALWVYERGEENGRIHIHAVIIPCGKLWKSTLEELWGAGFVDVQGFAPGGRARGAKAVERYLSKYMGKAGAREGLSRQRVHVTKFWPDVVTKAVGLALDPLNTADELCAQAKAKGCLVDNWHGELDDGTAYVGFEIRPPSGARFMPDVRCPVPLLLLRRVHLAQARRKESVIFYNHIEARRRGEPIVYMSTVNLSYRKGFNPGDYIQWDKGV